MANYENDAYTRQTIVQVCKKLFYEKGFHETSYGDICKAAHVNRGTLYYHFETKEDMRYEVQWEFIVANKHIAEKHCPDPRYHFILAMGIFWKQLQTDQKLQRFCMQSCIDFLSTPAKRISRIFITLPMKACGDSSGTGRKFPSWPLLRFMVTS